MKNGGVQNLQAERENEERVKMRQAVVKAEEARILATMGADQMQGEQLETLRVMARTQGEQVAHRAEGVHGVAVDGRRA